MTKNLLFLLLLLFPSFLFAQSAFSDCDIVFTSVQHSPSLKISNEAFQDTLAIELKSKKFSFKNNFTSQQGFQRTSICVLAETLRYVLLNSIVAAAGNNYNVFICYHINQTVFIINSSAPITF